MEPEQRQTMLASTTKPELTKATLALKYKTQTLKKDFISFFIFWGDFLTKIFSKSVFFFKYQNIMKKTFL